MRSRTNFPRHDFHDAIQDMVPATQSLLIVAIIDVLVTPEPGIFAMAR
jgi:hypothetical protein